MFFGEPNLATNTLLSFLCWMNQDWVVQQSILACLLHHFHLVLDKTRFKPTTFLSWVVSLDPNNISIIRIMFWEMMWRHFTRSAFSRLILIRRSSVSDFPLRTSSSCCWTSDNSSSRFCRNLMAAVFANSASSSCWNKIKLLILAVFANSASSRCWNKKQ